MTFMPLRAIAWRIWSAPGQPATSGPVETLGALGFYQDKGSSFLLELF